MPSYFYNSKVWKDVFSMYTGKTLAPDVVYIMAFVDFMSNMCFPVVVRLYIGRKMVGKPHVISPEVTNQLNEVDLGAHYTLDLCFLDGIFCLMKTSSPVLCLHSSVFLFRLMSSSVSLYSMHVTWMLLGNSG